MAEEEIKQKGCITQKLISSPVEKIIFQRCLENKVHFCSTASTSSNNISSFMKNICQLVAGLKRGKICGFALLSLFPTFPSLMPE